MKATRIRLHSLIPPAVMLVCGLLMIQVCPAQADEDENAAQREQAIQAINNELVTIAKQLEGIRDKDSDDGIQIAIRQADGMRQNISSLTSIKGDDSNANAIVDHYPDYIGAFEDSANALAKLKNAQLVQSEKSLWKRCSDENENLRKAVNQYLEPPDPIGREKIPELAVKTREALHDELARQMDQAGDVNRAYNDAKRFSISDAGWSDVSSRLREGAEGIWGIYEPRLKDIKQNCADLDRGSENPFIVESLSKLKNVSESSEQTLADILKDWGAWKELRRELAAKYVVNADKIRMAMCDGDDEQILSRVEDAETVAQGNLKGGYEALDKELDQLIERISKLENDRTVAANVQKWRGVMRGAKTRLVKVLQDGGILQGVQNAKVRTRIQIGIDKHAQLQTGCTANEYEIPGGRLDCLNISDGHCEVIEIKPKNDKALAKGREQLDGYKATIDQLHADNNLPVLLQRCVNEGQLNIEYDIETYEFCPVPDEDIDQMLADQAKQAQSSADDPS